MTAADGAFPAVKTADGLLVFGADGKHVGHGGPDELVAAMEGMRDE